MSNWFIIISLICISPALFAQGGNCPISKDSVVLFLDANDSPREIEKAREAACARGERLVVVEPDNLKSGIKQLADQNTPISSLIASGHDGGGSFYGLNGDMSKTQIIAALQEGYRGKE